jgi:hypothetical protein
MRLRVIFYLYPYQEFGCLDCSVHSPSRGLLTQLGYKKRKKETVFDEIHSFFKPILFIFVLMFLVFWAGFVFYPTIK